MLVDRERQAHARRQTDTVIAVLRHPFLGRGKLDDL